MADHMWIRGENGMLHQFQLPLPLGIEGRLHRGDLVRVNEDGSPWMEPGAVPEEWEPPRGDLPADAPPLPKRAESRAVWAEFAVSQGVDTATASTATKADLIKLLAGGTAD